MSNYLNKEQKMEIFVQIINEYEEVSQKEVEAIFLDKYNQHISQSTISRYGEELEYELIRGKYRPTKEAVRMINEEKIQEIIEKNDGTAIQNLNVHYLSINNGKVSEVMHLLEKAYPETILETLASQTKLLLFTDTNTDDYKKLEYFLDNLSISTKK